MLDPLNTEINTLETQLSTCTAAMSSRQIGLGREGVEAEGQAAECQNITSETDAFLLEKSIIQQGGIMTQTCSSNILNLEQQIYKLRQTALGEETGDLTTGSGPVGEGNAQRIAQTETQQETPLVQQVQQNIYYCQS